MANLRNCRSCGKVFNYVAGKPICPACREAEEKKFQEVKDFVREHREAEVNEICECCDVPNTLLRQWIREEKLLFSDDSPIGIDCEGCGCMIKTGRYCDRCKADITKGLGACVKKDEGEKENPFSAQKKAPNNNKMRFLQ